MTQSRNAPLPFWTELARNYLLRKCNKMAARMMSPAKKIVLLVVGALWSTISVQTLKNDEFSEELYINSMNDGHVLSHFQFTTLWNSSIVDQNTCRKTGGHLKIIILYIINNQNFF